MTAQIVPVTGQDGKRKSKLQVRIYEKDRDAQRFEVATVTGWTYPIIQACIAWNLFGSAENWINGAPQIERSKAIFSAPNPEQKLADYTELNNALVDSTNGVELMQRTLIKPWTTNLDVDAYEQMIFDLTQTRVKLDWLRHMTGDQRTEESYGATGYAAAPPPEPVPSIDPPKGRRKRDEFFPEKEEKREQKMVVWLAALGAAAAAMFYF